jgi:biopolymer transport protein ExbD
MIRRRRRLPTVVPVASIGDIAFLLIIFFMLTSQFMKQANIELEEPIGPDIERVEKSPLTIQVDRDGVVWIRGQRLPPDLVENTVTSLLDNLEEEHRQVHVKVDRRVLKKDFMPVIEALSRASVRVTLLGERGEEE